MFRQIRGWRHGLVALLLVSSTACAGAAPSLPAAEAPASGPVPAMIPAGGEAEAGGLRRMDADARGAVPDGLVLIRTARVGVAVDSYDEMRASLGEWLAQHEGFVADEDVWRWDGRASSASLRLRVPAAGLDSLLEWLDDELAVEHLESRAADVTAEWVDLEARLRAHRAAEERLLGLLHDRAAAHAFRASIGAMGQTARGLVIVGAALAPWIAAVGVGGGGVALALGGALGALSRRRRPAR